MSHTSPHLGRPVTTSPATGSQQHDYHSGTATASSTPRNEGTTRNEPYGNYDVAMSGRSQAEMSAEEGNRRQSFGSAGQTPSRSIGMHSILNPQAEPEEQRRQPQSSMSMTAPSMLQGPEGSPRSRKRRGSPSSPQRNPEHGSSVRPGRNLLTPKSPMSRAASLDARRNTPYPSRVQPGHHTSTPTGRVYTAEPGRYTSSEIPPLPSVAVATTSNVVQYAAGEPSQPRSAHPTDSSARSTDSNIHDYTRTEHPSPDYRFGARHSLTQPSYYRGLPPGGGGFGHETHVHGPHEGYQTSQASYQMTLDTDQGPVVVPVELDLQQASRVADEKRKRNAGASARFRARRKEKEKEASDTISGLQGELRDLMAERDFYMAERNYFRDLVNRNALGGQILPRPLSPRLHRRRVTSAPGSSSLQPLSDDLYRDYSEPETTQRRRTGDYDTSFVGVQTQSPTTSVYTMGFPSAPPLPPPPALPGAASFTPGALPPGPPPQPSVTRSQSYDPFRRSPYDQSWNPGR